MKQKIINFALPISLEVTLFMFVGVIDQFFVTFLGDVYVGAVGLTNQIFFTSELIIGAIGIGMTSVIARLFGNGELRKFVTTGYHFIYLSILISSLFWAMFFFGSDNILSLMAAKGTLLFEANHFLQLASFSFPALLLTEMLTKIIRTTGDSKSPFYITLVSIAINSVLNYCAVFGIGSIPSTGIIGIAYATIIARSCGLLLALAVLYKNNSPFRKFFPPPPSSVLASLGNICKFSLPVFAGETLRNIGLAIFMGIAAQTSTQALVAYQIAFNIETFLILVSYGLSPAALVFVGHELGKKDITSTIKISNIIIHYTLITATVTGLLTVLCSFLISNIYSELDTTILQYIAPCLILLGIAQPVKTLAMIFRNGILRSGGDNSFLLQVEIVANIFGLFLAYYLTQNFFSGPFGIFLGNVTGETIRLLAYYTRFKGNKWIHAELL